MKRILPFLLALMAFSCVFAQNPKREFRGAWIHVIGQSQWMKMTPKQQQEYISRQFELLERAGCNAVFFQVRPTADALYKSKYEPWSVWLTGRRGKAPSQDWDPLAYAVEEAHKRGLELHAWLNPYRVTSDPKEVLPEDHDANVHPERFVRYDGKVFFDPAYQENRDFICMVVEDIVSRYDVDGIHLDDYFYPYPVAGKPFEQDAASYAKFGQGKNRADWRRENVDKLIAQLHKTVKSTKPWVRFGVSPFGIWRNKKTDPKGSATNGLQNYDDLYADPLNWAKNGWVDYLAPQLYWALNHNLASTEVLAHWWNDNVEGTDVYIGYDVRQTMGTADSKTGAPNELDSKVNLSRSLDNVKGNIWWHGYWVTDNYKGASDLLSNKYQSTLALAPAYGNPSEGPSPISGMKFVRNDGRVILEWSKPSHSGKKKATDAVKYVVYEFLPDEDASNLESAEAIITITPNTRIVLAEKGEEESIKGNTYVVTAVDRMNRESRPTKLRLR